MLSKEAAFSNLIIKMMEDTQSMSLMLSMTNSLNAEEVLKSIGEKKGFKIAVTEFGGNEEDCKNKIVKAVVGACLNNHVIEKDSMEVHAVIHATEEALRGFVLNTGLAVNVALKIAIVRKDRWISVALFGFSALHYLTNHKRAGVGTMHI